MKFLVSLAALLAVGLAEDPLEPADFDVRAALQAEGVDVSNIPNSAKRADSACSAACDILEKTFGDGSVLKESSPAYKTFTQSYWSAQQRNITPGCIFKPEQRRDVSVLVLVSRLMGCPFAVKSGGHSAVPGGSNVQDGITVSFERMNRTTPSADKKSVTFEPGQTWVDVYRKLEQDKLAIIGGRAASVGVGGLTLGGGISYFSSMYGLACDNVISYKLVTACGKVINVDKDSYPDLFFALRGGGNNFGIVTKFNVVAIARDPIMWGGTRTYTSRTFPALLKAYYNLGLNATKDGKAHQILSFAWAGGEIGPIAVVELEHADKVENATVLSEYNAISREEAVQYNTSFKSLVQLTSELGETAAAPGLRQQFWTWTSKLDLDQATRTKDIFYEELNKIAEFTDISPALSLQVITEPMIEKTARNGGNPLGLDPQDGPLMLSLVSIRWTKATHDQTVHDFAEKVLKRCVASAKEAGTSTDYLYMNYASPWQDVIAGYGPENKARLRDVANKYDPTSAQELP
ncbi:uncharacterized protein SETTUDRAFT_25780 [Exserohilum turcica Et28A]|uniref:FAD-binding PCMH-type domain-containing protein n=1 Tax=Exserohilum turcicum (strain 28A) TaxID=671987 RepID=R0KRS4_EXST2|nr:uncharacterized protein SETTUDRAFT_25780 [Exserohilum turcica Et28A]EOA90517.1 hypothetical protein SETTUDRAFT_25780 [Exserohilum turcica Et28A]